MHEQDRDDALWDICAVRDLLRRPGVYRTTTTRARGQRDASYVTNVSEIPGGPILNSLEGVRAQLEPISGIDKLDAGEHADAPGELSPGLRCDGGKRLDPGLMAAARKAEMDFLLGELKAYKYDQTSSCLAETGRRPIPCKWVGVNKGDVANPQI